jgi:putative transposase
MQGKEFKEKLREVQHKINGIHANYTCQTTSEIINRKPMFITIEDLNVKGMMKNKHLAKAVQEQCFYEFRRQLEYKTLWNNIELRIVDRWYPSSKTCHECGYIKKDLNLSDREWVCPECGIIHDRDYNASLNLRDCKEYQIYIPA